MLQTFFQHFFSFNRWHYFRNISKYQEITTVRGNKQSSDNYRSLTIGTGLAKILDIVILNQQADKLKTSDLQYGFKEKSSKNYVHIYGIRIY